MEAKHEKNRCFYWLTLLTTRISHKKLHFMAVCVAQKHLPYATGNFVISLRLISYYIV